MRAYELHEGLIQVPQKLLSEIEKFVFDHVFSVIGRNFDESTRMHYPHHYAAFRGISNQLGVKPVARNDGPIAGIELYFKPQDLPTHYPRRDEEEKKFTLIVLLTKDDYPQYSNTYGAWAAKEHILVINPMANARQFSFPFKCEPREILHYVRELKDTILHELRHVTQTFSVGDDSTSSMPVSGSPPDKTLYYSDPVEFDPQIGSMVHKLISAWNEAHWVGHRSRTGLTAMIRYMINNSAFFTTLKATDPARYKLAVKKFMKEVMQQA